MNPVIVAFEEKIFVQRDAAIVARVKFHHPTTDAVGIELLVPGGIKRVGEIDSFTIAADFYHLWASREGLIGLARMRCAIDDAADANGAGLLWIERI